MDKNKTLSGADSFNRGKSCQSCFGLLRFLRVKEFYDFPMSTLHLIPVELNS